MKQLVRYEAMWYGMKQCFWYEAISVVWSNVLCYEAMCCGMKQLVRYEAMWYGMKQCFVVWSNVCGMKQCGMVWSNVLWY